jgi:hypothetical protein
MRAGARTLCPCTGPNEQLRGPGDTIELLPDTPGALHNSQCHGLCPKYQGHTAQCDGEFCNALGEHLGHRHTPRVFHTREAAARYRLADFKHVVGERALRLRLVKTEFHSDGVPLREIHAARGLGHRI